MKKLTYFLLIVMLCYFAGVYQQFSLMTVVVGLLLFGLAMLILSRYLRHHLRVTIPKQDTTIFRNVENEFSFQILNTSDLPADRFCLTFCLQYLGSKKRITKKYFGSARGKAYNDENLSSFYLTAPHCGIIVLTPVRLRVYDYMGVFSSSQKLSGSEEILIMPPRQQIQLQLPPFGTYEGDPLTDLSNNRPGDDHSDIRQLREYRDGDLYKHVHRNMSAKTQTLWVKEYNQENDIVLSFYIDTSFEDPPSPEQTDAFYEILYAVLEALLPNNIIIKAYSFDSSAGGFVSDDITDENAIQKLFHHLYRSQPCTKAASEEYRLSLPGNTMRLDTGLHWYFGDNLIHAFHADTCSQELADGFFAF